MKAHLKAANGRITFEVEGETAKELWQEIAAIDEVFSAQNECGLCHSANLRYRVRPTDKGSYFELVCSDCDARFDFGQTMDTKGLFPKPENREKGWRGWYHYHGPNNPPPAPPPGPPSRIPAGRAPAQAAVPRGRLPEPPLTWASDGMQEDDGPPF